MGSSTIEEFLDHPTGTVADARAVTQLIASTVADARASVESVTFLEPLGQKAVEITLTASDPREFIAHRPVWLERLLEPFLREGSSTRTDGAYLEVKDASGKVAMISAYSIRTGEGLGYISEEFASEFSRGLIDG